MATRNLGKLYAVPVGRHFIEIRVASVKPVCVRSVVQLDPITIPQYTAPRGNQLAGTIVDKVIRPKLRSTVYEGGEVIATFKRGDFLRVCMETTGLTNFRVLKAMKEFPEASGAILLKKLHKASGRAAR